MLSALAKRYGVTLPTNRDRGGGTPADGDVGREEGSDRGDSPAPDILIPPTGNQRGEAFIHDGGATMAVHRPGGQWYGVASGV